MRRTIVFAVAMLLVLSLAVPLLAEEPMGPPKILNIVREEVKPGKTVAHTQHEVGWSQGYAKAKYTTQYLGLLSVTGSSEAWWLTGFKSFADLEKDNENQSKNAAIRNVNETFSVKESEYLENARAMTARFRPELSYNPGVNIGEYRYFAVRIMRVKMGESATDFFKALNGAREKAKSDGHVAVYEVNSGMPAGTFISFSPVKSLASWDDPPNPAMTAALEEIKFDQLVGRTFQSSEPRLFSFAPELSSVDDHIAAANPDFWRPKHVIAKKAAAAEPKVMAKKEVKK
jgi:hypothetical protein